MTLRYLPIAHYFRWSHQKKPKLKNADFKKQRNFKKIFGSFVIILGDVFITVSNGHKIFYKTVVLYSIKFPRSQLKCCDTNLNSNIVKSKMGSFDWHFRVASKMRSCGIFDFQRISFQTGCHLGEQRKIYITLCSGSGTMN